ncbi:hypothetical protein CAPTEDRAFT_212394 [Capitella teleta]|uniref:2-amino-3-carboxymuconate-6-semialdehyde decarboxylase n=1 Tax=Capitella teleta TaxID=283909 RepID=R7V567_CAPTE|nr:hypothetical protein CAPTEDRAFT_212394 [Capitella teleta]|eukprot:ELU14013.1 hypothetical protein CAPTEDRAFT_212394 [Capitella teleta]
MSLIRASAILSHKGAAQIAFSTVAATRSQHVVDVWCQPAEEGFIKGLPEVDPLLVASKSPAKAMIKAGIGPAEHISLMVEAGLTRSFMCAWTRPGKEVITNERIAEYTKFSEKFVGIGTVQLDNPMKAVRQVETCVKEHGFKGIRILPWLWDKPPTYNWFYPVFAKCIELDVPFLTQVGITGPLCPSEPGRPVPYIDQVALDFPELKIICGHIGYPWTDEMISVAWKHKNVYIDTSAHAPRYYPKQLLHFMTSYGSKKVMFGTNFPQLMWNNCVEQAQDLHLPPEAYENFMWKNANDVFQLDLK